MSKSIQIVSYTCRDLHLDAGGSDTATWRLLARYLIDFQTGQAFHQAEFYGCGVTQNCSSSDGEVWPTGAVKDFLSAAAFLFSSLSFVKAQFAP